MRAVLPDAEQFQFGVCDCVRFEFGRRVAPQGHLGESAKEECMLAYACVFCVCLWWEAWEKVPKKNVCARVHLFECLSVRIIYFLNCVYLICVHVLECVHVFECEHQLILKIYCLYTTHMQYAKFQEIEAMFDPGKNHQLYRTALAKSEPPVLPYLGMRARSHTLPCFKKTYSQLSSYFSIMFVFFVCFFDCVSDCV